MGRLVIDRLCVHKKSKGKVKTECGVVRTLEPVDTGTVTALRCRGRSKGEIRNSRAGGHDAATLVRARDEVCVLESGGGVRERAGGGRGPQT